MNKLVSICIPTYQRPKLLKEAIESCLEQKYKSIEIIVSDDSNDSRTENLIKDLQSDCKFKLRYVRNSPSLGQAGNVNQLFDLAEGDRLVLLHDDDLLLPNAISDLDKCWQQEPELTVAFGKQYLISMTGEILDQQSEELNQNYYRTAFKKGLQQSSIESALLQQFPNDGYMILSSAARSTKYRDESEVKTNRWCDFDFGIRLASKFEKFYFLDRCTAKYRLTDISVSSAGKPVYMYPVIESLQVEDSIKSAKKKALQALAPQVVRNYAIRQEKSSALRIYFSENYSLKRRLSLQGIYHLLLIMSPSFESLLKKIKSRLLKFNSLQTSV